MSIEIAIIPISPIFESHAHHIYNNLKASVNDIGLEIDTNYFASLKARTSKHRRKNKDIVLIDHQYNDFNKITIRFAGHGHNDFQMPVQELVELITTLQEEEQEEISKHDIQPPKLTNEDENEIKNINEENNESNCFIM